MRFWDPNLFLISPCDNKGSALIRNHIVVMIIDIIHVCLRNGTNLLKVAKLTMLHSKNFSNYTHYILLLNFFLTKDQVDEFLNHTTPTAITYDASLCSEVGSRFKLFNNFS